MDVDEEVIMNSTKRNKKIWTMITWIVVGIMGLSMLSAPLFSYAEELNSDDWIISKKYTIKQLGTELNEGDSISPSKMITIDLELELRLKDTGGTLSPNADDTLTVPIQKDLEATVSTSQELHHYDPADNTKILAKSSVINDPTKGALLKIVFTDEVKTTMSDKMTIKWEGFNFYFANELPDSDTAMDIEIFGKKYKITRDKALISKSAAKPEKGVIKWTIDYIHSPNIPLEGSEIQFKDVLPAGLELPMEGSLPKIGDGYIQIKKLTPDSSIGNIKESDPLPDEVNYVNYDGASRTLFFKLPDGGRQSIRFIFHTKVNAAGAYENKAELMTDKRSPFRLIMATENITADDLNPSQGQGGGSFKIKKIGPDHLGLEGAIFRLSNTNGVQIGPDRTTPAGGVLQFDNLQEGKYVLVETQAPTGYKISTGEINIEVRDTPGSISYTVWINGQSIGNDNFEIMNEKQDSPPPSDGGGLPKSPVRPDPDTNIPDEESPKTGEPTKTGELPTKNPKDGSSSEHSSGSNDKQDNTTPKLSATDKKLSKAVKTGIGPTRYENILSATIGVLFAGAVIYKASRKHRY